MVAKVVVLMVAEIILEVSGNWTCHIYAFL